MSAENVKTKLSDLRLHGMLQAYELQCSSRSFDGFSRDEIIEHLAVAETQLRNDRARARLRKAAALKHQGAEPEDIIFDPKRGFEKRMISELLSVDWISRTENLLISGASGTGKTWIASAIGNSVMRQKLPVRYARTNELLKEIKLAEHTGTLTKIKRNLLKVPLLILDDFAIGSIDDAGTEYLLDILDARNDIAATMVVGQRTSGDWYEYFGSSHMADAIIDRLVQRAHRLDLKGPSLRKRLS